MQADEQIYRKFVEHDPVVLFEQFVNYWYGLITHRTESEKEVDNFEISHFHNIMDYFVQRAPVGYLESLDIRFKEKINYLRHLNPSFCYLPKGYGEMSRFKMKTISYFDAKDLDTGIIGRKDKRRYCGIDPNEPVLKKQVLINVVNLYPRVSQSSHYHSNELEYIIAVDPTVLVTFPADKRCKVYRLKPGDLVVIGANVFHTLINENYVSGSMHICIKFPANENDRKSYFPNVPEGEITIYPRNDEKEFEIHDKETKLVLGYTLVSLTKISRTFRSVGLGLIYMCGGDVSYRFKGEQKYKISAKGSVILFNKEKSVEMKMTDDMPAQVFIVDQKSKLDG